MYPRTPTQLRLTINAADRTAYLLSSTMVVRQVLNNQADTARFALKQPETWRSSIASIKPSVGQEVLIEYRIGAFSYQPLFGGTIARVSEPKLSTKRVRWDVQCVDWTQLLRRKLVVRQYPGVAVEDILYDLLARYAPQVQPTHIAEIRTIVFPAFNYQYVADCIDELASMVECEWYVDSAKGLHFFQATAGGAPASQSLTDTSANFYDLSIEPDLTQVRNRIFVQGGEALSDEMTETFQTTGALRDFSLKNRDVVEITVWLDGAEQPLGVEGIGDEILFNFMVNRDLGVVRNSKYQPTIPAGHRLVARYKYHYPIAVVVEDVASQRTVAALAGRTFTTEMAARSPTAWWEMADAGATMVDTVGAHDGAYVSSPTLGEPGPLVGEPDRTAVRFNGVDQTATVPHNAALQLGSDGGSWFINFLMRWNVDVTDPLGAYLMSKGTKWAVRLGFVAPGAVWLYSSDYTAGTSAIDLDQHIGNSTVMFGVGDGEWHMVTFAFNGLTGRLSSYIDGQERRAASSTLTLGADTNVVTLASGLGFFPAGVTLAQVAIGKGVTLSAQEVSGLWDAAREDGVREHRVSKGDLKSTAEARAVGNLELSRWSQVIVPIKWTSDIHGWELGTVVPVALTEAGIGRTFSGSAKIQEIEISALGGGQIRWRIGAQQSRFDAIDFWRALVRRGNVVPGKGGADLALIGGISDQGIIVIDGGPTLSDLGTSQLISGGDRLDDLVEADWSVNTAQAPWRCEYAVVQAGST